MARLAIRKHEDMKAWEILHNAALQTPSVKEVGVVQLLQSWETYANNHRARFETSIGDDAVLARYWSDIGSAIIGLLNGDIGRLDGGTVDKYVRELARENGVKGDL